MDEIKQYALLIDADNISSKYIKTIFDEIEKYGYASYRRIYGNWSRGNGWDESTLLEYSINPIQQFSYTAGKNATDMAMVIDAMDILYSNKVDGFCLVTSDSDFTRLAMRLREEKKYVLGMGEAKTPIALAKACNKFIHLNLIAEQDRTHSNSDSITSKTEIEEAITAMLNEKDLISLGEIGGRLDEKFSDYDVRNYGYTKLNVFIKEEMKNFSLIKKGSAYFIAKKGVTDQEMLRKEVITILEEHDGVIENLALINDELKNRHSHLDLKDYGFSRISSFLRSMPELSVVDNKVSIKKAGGK